MVKLKSIKLGDTIGIVSPSSAEYPEKIQKGIAELKSLGFKVKEGKFIYKRKGYLAGEDYERASDLMNMFMDPSVDMILCVRGGYGAMRILPYLNFHKIKKNPKIFMGFSDITVLLNTINSKCGFPTFHGPMGTSNLTDKYTLKSFLDTILNKLPNNMIENPREVPYTTFKEGIAEGNLVGGNLCLICSTLGTPYEINTKNKILFLEDVGEAPYKIDRMLTQLLLANKLQQCSAIILGQFTNCTLQHYERSLTLEQVFEDRLKDLNIPILKDFATGHSYPKLTLPIGPKVRLNTCSGCIELLNNLFK
ncbi:S66 peptidase family protein [Hathewaya limosa]|uniref:Muramoyltetrapeptide carboxypeptidase n=1 Tax=Hathewaya limosa TaxID=1536 RepID=A0ABU0JSP2_HATLI|nr:LD-carboxypeptidase [Hathewaya limosa]MDQ0480110.1 muramoyltetrapeptide carboxypeptidase [Hathewaya limosa]